VVPQVAEALGGVHAVVAHSMGAAATAAALREGLELARVVLLAPADDPRKAVAFFAQRLQLTQEVLARMTARVEQRVGRTFADYDVRGFAPLLKVPALVFHDVEDTEVDFSSGEAIARAWPGARLVPTEGLGHNRILYTPAVVQQAVAFVAESHPLRARQPGPTAPLEAPPALPQPPQEARGRVH
jgi:pimeloyl-ACP methyl ester carboxylesterase